MICPRCGDIIEVTSSVVATSKGWMHGACGGRTLVPAQPDILEDIVTLLKRMVQVDPIGDQTREEWAESRARNCVQALIADYNITRKE